METFLVEHTAGPTIDVAPTILSLRDALLSGISDLLAIDDDELELPWSWFAGEEPADIRYAFFRCFEALETGGAIVSRRLDETRAARSPATRLIAPATVARWQLHGILAALDDDMLDREPARGEWTMRQTLAHIVNGQRAYGAFTAWWHERASEAEFPAAVPDSVVAAADVSDEVPDGEGTLLEIRRRLDAVLDFSAGRLGDYDDDDLAVRARWSGLPVTVGFRLGRWSSHLVEHTIQIQKTLVMLDRRPTEVERLVHTIAEAYGRLEATTLALSPSSLERADDRGATAADAVRQLAAELTLVTRSAREAAGG
jgi:uncharacterized damage-inducible protein DinB